MLRDERETRLLFSVVNGAGFAALPCRVQGVRANARNRTMRELFRVTAAPAAGLLALALSSIATPAAAGKYEYCRTDTSYMRSCGYETMEQCQAAASGRGGSCARDYLLPTSDPRNSFAYQPGSGVKKLKKPAQ